MHRSVVLSAAFVLLLASLAQPQVVEYYHLDAMGSVRAVTDQNGQLIERHDYLPFGEEWNPQPASQPLRFTGKERDRETGLDYFGARYYAAHVGRFTTVDPVYTLQENVVDPQRWNRYAYGRNNPLLYLDPSGKAIQLVGNEEQRKTLLGAIRQGLGEAGSYVFEEKRAGGYFVGVHLRGPKGEGPLVSDFGLQASILASIILDERLVKFSIKSEPGSHNLERLDSTSPGMTTDARRQHGFIDVVLLDPRHRYDPLPGSRMSDRRPGSIDPGLVTMHEFGHAANYLGFLFKPGDRADSREAAVLIENAVRASRAPDAAIRARH